MSKNIFGIGGLAVASVLLTACHEQLTAPVLQELPVARVTVLQVEPRTMMRTELLPGTVVPRTKVALESKITGRILELNAELGQSVRAGDVLIRIQAPEMGAQVEKASAALELASKNEARIAKLFARQAATQAELDAARSQLMQATAAAAEAGSMLAYAIVKAPFDGVVSGKFADVGDLSTPGRTLVEIEDPAGKQFQANVPETLMTGLKEGGKNGLQFPGSQKNVGASLAEIDPAGAPSSRTWLVKWDLPPDVNARSGAYGQVAIPVGESELIQIPIAALMLRGQLEQVFVAEDGHAVLRLVKTGIRAGDRVEILSGLMAGDQVVTQHPVELRDGQPVSF